MLHFDGVANATEDVHVSFDERGSVAEAAGGMRSFHFDVLDPLHLLEVEHSQLVREGVGGADLADGAVVAAEKDEQRVEEDAGLFFEEDVVGFGDVGRAEPSALGDVEGVVVFEDVVVVAPVDQDLVAVDLHGVEGPAVGHHFLEVHALEVAVDPQHRVVELAARLASENEKVLAHAAHRVALYSLVGQVAAAPRSSPPEHAAPGCALCAVEGERAGTFFDGGGGSVGGDESLVDDYAVVERPEGVGNCGVLFVDEVLAAVLELELVGVVGLELQVGDAMHFFEGTFRRCP